MCSKKGMGDFVYQSLSNFSVKDQIVNILGLVVHMVSITTFQLCCESTRTVTDNV